QEHNHRLHDEGDKKYLCDYCSRGFWHFGEFQAHRASHTGLKPFTCGRCQAKSFANAERLTKHLERCGKSSTAKCNQCGKLFTDQRGVARHVQESHGNRHWPCPFCDSVYKSEGGYYTHLRNKHHIGRNGKKLSAALIEQELFSVEGKGVDEEPKRDIEDDEPSQDKDINDTSKNPNDGNISASVSTDEVEDVKNAEITDNKNEHQSRETVTGDMSHKCPFPRCEDLELPNEEEYFTHLWVEHKLGRNK
ncbi:MAG: hypothetical protein MJE68_00425, partial [Proteobacteria bacterium]|nr:hypothetical protein [Pseudomonadota bacterium]